MIIRPRWELVLSDASGTYSDDRTPVYNADMRILDDAGIGRIPLDVWRTLPPANAIEFCRYMGVPLSDQKAYERFLQYFTEEAQTHPPQLYPGARDAFGAIRAGGRPLGIISGHPHDKLEQEGRGYGIWNLFSVVKGGSRNKARDIRAACDEMGVPPAQTLYFCDMITDIDAARAAGAQPLCVAHGYHTAEMLTAALGPEQVRDFLVPDLVALANGPLTHLLAATRSEKRAANVTRTQQAR